MKLTKKEEAWLERFRKTMAAAPKSLGDKIDSYTIGDPYIVMYDKKGVEEFEKEEERKYCKRIDQMYEDHYQLVDASGVWQETIDFPFGVASTAG